MTTKMTILVSGITPEIHEAIVKTIAFAAVPFGGKWVSNVTIENIIGDVVVRIEQK